MELTQEELISFFLDAPSNQSPDELFQQLAHRVQRVLFILAELLQREGRESQRFFAVADKSRRIIFLRNQIAQPQ